MENVLFVGDSHIFHCFADGNNVVYYIRDITLNKIRQHNNNLFVDSKGFVDDIKSVAYNITLDGENIVDMINNSSYTSVVFSIGEIDVRFHLEKRLSVDAEALIKISNVYFEFLRKINKKIVLCSIIPPSISGNHLVKQKITRELNTILYNKCVEEDYIYYDLYQDYQNKGYLDINKSNDGTHINKCFNKDIINKIKKLL